MIWLLLLALALAQEDPGPPLGAPPAPPTWDAMVEAAVADLRAGNVEEFERRYEALLKEAREELNEGDRSEAERMYQTLLWSFAPTQRASLGLAAAIRAQGRTDEAIAAYEELGENPEALEALAELLEDDEPERALEKIRTLQRLQPENAGWFLEEAELLCPEEAEEGQTIDPQGALTALRRFFEKNRDEEEEKETRPVLQCLVREAAARAEKGDEQTAMALLQEMLDLTKGYPNAGKDVIDGARARLNRIQILEKARDLSLGRSRSLTAEEQRRVDAALAEARAGRPETARDALSQVVKDAPEAPAAWAALGDVYASLGDIREAEQAYLRAIALAPDDPRWHAKRGLLLAERYGGRLHNEARLELRLALDLRPAWAEIAFALGEVHVGLKEWELAIEAFKHYLAAAPNGEHAATARRWIEDLSRPIPDPERPRPPIEEDDGIPESIRKQLQIALAYRNKAYGISENDESNKEKRELARKEELDLARSELAAVLAAAPGWHKALNLHAELTWEQDPAAAIDAWERSLEAQPDQPSVKLRLSDALRQQGRDAEAEALLLEAAEAGVPQAEYLLAKAAFERGDLLDARDRLDRYFALTPGEGLTDAEARGLLSDVEARFRKLQILASGGFAASLVLGGVLWLRRRARPTLEDLLERAPSAAHDLARLLSSIRHEVLKHNTTLLEEMAFAFRNGDHHALVWASERLFGGGSAGGSGVIERFDGYRAAIERLGRQHGVRLDLRRHDPVMAPMHRAMRQLAGLKKALQKPGSERGLDRKLLELSGQLNGEGYRALGRLLQQMGILRIDEDALRAVDERVRAEPGLAGEALPALEIEGAKAGLPARVFRGDFEDIAANLLRNAYFALNDLPPDRRRVAVLVEEEDDPITGLEAVVLRFCDTAPGRLTGDMLRGRSIGRGLGLAVDLITRHNGSIEVEPAEGFTKAVVVRLPRAEEEEATEVLVTLEDA